MWLLQMTRTSRAKSNQVFGPSGRGTSSLWSTESALVLRTGWMMKEGSSSSCLFSHQSVTLCQQVPLRIRLRALWGGCWSHLSVTILHTSWHENSSGEWVQRTTCERKERGVWHSVTQTETTDAQKQKSDFLCMTATEPGVEDRVEDKHGNRKLTMHALGR